MAIKKDDLVVTSTTRLFIGLGANLTPEGYATPQAGCEAAMTMLGDLGVTVIRMSRWYESAPVPPSDQPWYLNAVAVATTSFDAAETLAILHQVEAILGGCGRCAMRHVCSIWICSILAAKFMIERS